MKKFLLLALLATPMVYSNAAHATCSVGADTFIRDTLLKPILPRDNSQRERTRCQTWIATYLDQCFGLCSADPACNSSLAIKICETACFNKFNLSVCDMVPGQLPGVLNSEGSADTATQE
jgi:hypothetical protein